MSILKVQFRESKDHWGDIIGESVSCEAYPKLHYDVWNLCECPEDAIIGRDLFDGDQYIEAVKLGMELAQQGYTSIEIEEIGEEE